MSNFKVLAGLDCDPKYISSFRRNFPDSVSITDSIIDLHPEQFAEISGIENGKLDLLAGGPPCQGFSKNVPRKFRRLDDPRNTLVKRFLDYADYFSPPIIIMENVAEMRNGFDGHYTEEVTERLSCAGYSVSHFVINAAEYGVPQKRRRAFFVANRFGIQLKAPLPTHGSDPMSSSDLFSDPMSEYVTVWDAIGDLPSLEHGEGVDVTEYACAPFSSYQKMMRNDCGTVTNHIARALQSKQFERLNSLQPGQGLKDLPSHLRTKGGYSGAYGRLTKEMVAPTITRWVFHPGSGRWGHPVDIRVLTIREVARIQGFPDSFCFEGSYNDQAGQLGNAVPPIVINKIVESIDQQLAPYKSSSKSASTSNEMRSRSSGSLKAMA